MTGIAACWLGLLCPELSRPCSSTDQGVCINLDKTIKSHSPLSLPTEVYKWVLANCKGNLDAGRGPFIIVTSCYMSEPLTELWVHILSNLHINYNGPVLSDHPLLSGQFSKSWFFSHTNFYNNWFPASGSHLYSVAVLCLSFFNFFFNCIKRPPLSGN